MEEYTAESPKPTVSVVTTETNIKSKLDKLNPLMCFECSEVLPNTEELKQHVQTHINSMLRKSVESLDQSRSFDMPSFDKLLKDSTESTGQAESSKESSYFDTYMKARGLDNLSFGGTKRERESTKSPSIQGNIKEITVTVTSTSGDGQELKFICPICGQTCPSTEELGKHIEQHSGFSCTICGRSYSTKGNLQTHMKKHNNGENTLLKCPFCDKSFISQAVLKVHMRSHTGEKPFICDTCGVAFTKNIHLKRHLAIHTGIKPHQCEICQKRFSRSDHLKRHVQSIHTQNRPHLCSLCGKDFVRKYELNKHMKQMHWGFTVGQNGTSSRDASLNADQNEPELVFDSELNQNMHKLKGAFIMGDNNNDGDGAADNSMAQSEDSGLMDESLAHSEETPIKNHVE